MRAKTRTHRIAAALCAVPFLVMVGAGAASAAPATAPAAAPSHSSSWYCDDDWGRYSDCCDDCGHYGFHHYDYGYDYGTYGFVIIVA
ncbi:hypothetical protein [Streptomyces chattanoogensis]|uniref:hypothetical protein n=1 Tax=Streptomyces chattanoogensis TaxID=66876 RepID=UPI000AD022F4|nr:hypothetical protein [Streptomyces chattanoogensis]